MDAHSKKLRAERGNRAKAGLSGAVASLRHHHQRLQAGGEEMLIGTRVLGGPGRLDGGQIR